MIIRSTVSLVGKIYKPLLLVLAMLVSMTGMAQNHPLQRIAGKSITLPPPGTQQNVGDLSVNMILSPNGKYAISADTGFNETVFREHFAKTRPAIPRRNL
jgi:hypothetical protein